MYFAQAREYRPDIGRFSSVDIVKGFMEFTQSLNPYSYCLNQPIDYIDLDGLIFRRVANTVSNAARAAGQWVSDNRDTIMAAAAVVAIGAAAILTGGAALAVIGGVAKVAAISTATTVAAKTITTAFIAYQAISCIGRVTYREDSDRTLDGRWVSNYRGQIVVRVPFMRSGVSAGPLMLLGANAYSNRPDREERLFNLLRHEHGHFLQYQELGFWRYYLGIALPSLINSGRIDSQRQPWEVDAYVRAGLPRNLCICYFDRAEAHFNHLYSIRGVGWLQFIGRDMWNFIRRDFSVLNMDECEECE